MSLELTQYQCLVFDCDGVILNSNKVKTQAFYNAALGFGESKAQELVEYHIKNGGVSRYLKFEFFIKNILNKEVTQNLLDELLTAFAKEVKEGLINSQVAQGLIELREKTKQANWLIVSGGDQSELREVFLEKGLLELFDSGIFGSPDNKDIILTREKNNQVIKGKALFLGDSKYDYEAASRADLDFVFLTDWSEVKDWQSYAAQNNLLTLNSISALL